jgi:hypothetical protein
VELHKNHLTKEINSTRQDKSNDVKINELRLLVQKLFLCEFYVDFCGMISKWEELNKNFSINKFRHSDYSHLGGDTLYNFLIGKC